MYYRTAKNGALLMGWYFSGYVNLSLGHLAVRSIENYL